jgi:hypothetical protein
MEEVRMINGAQRGAIFALAKVAGLDNDALHDVVKQITGADSISALTSWQAGQVIESLKRQTGQDAPWGWMSDGQRWKAYALCRELGWVTEAGEVDVKRLEAFVRSRFGVAKLQWVNVETASKVINGLNAMLKRARSKPGA